MGAISGMNGNVTFATGYTTGVYNWTIDYVADAPETTVYASLGFRDYIPGLKGWSGTYECRLDDVTMLVHPGHPAAAATFQAHPGVIYVGSIVITNISIGAPVDGICPATFTFQGSGHLRIVGRTTTTTTSSTSSSSTSSSTSSTSSSPTTSTSTSSSSSTSSTSSSTSTAP